uniref:Uncharacterized protein n=1 Tax=Macrostomum lignano TaxID=282301 RepID=A0A1I8H3V0_9PLAT
MHHRLTCCPGIDTASTDQLFGCRICGLVTNRLFMSSVETRPAKRQSLSTAEAGGSKRSSISSEKNARNSNSRTRKAASRAAVRHSLPATASKKAKSRKSLNSAKLLEARNSVALKTEQKSVCASPAASAAAVAKKTRTRAAAVAAAVATTAAILNGGSKSKTPSSKSKTQSNSKPAPRICVSHEIFSAMSAASGDVRVRLGRLPQAVLDQLHRNGKFVLPAGSGADDFATDADRTCSSTSTSAEEQQAQQQRLVDQLPPAPVLEPPPEPVMSPLLPVSMVGDEPLCLPETSQPPIDGVLIEGDGNCGRDGELVDNDERDDADKYQATATGEMQSEAVGLQLVTVPLEA